ncbi:MAG: FtsX-like permease family protein [Bacillota bacterium]|nr:FtsX-like permease family protein [Bacillota bacterium]MDW7683358.1 FtsX-like permease family protein [Bacillota bacterium]
MSIYQIALSNLKRRKVKMAFLVIGLVVGVATVVALFSIVQAMRLELGERLDEFGANVVITPRSEGMELSYGGTHVSEVAFDVEMLTEADLPKIREIPDGESINIISPKIVGAVTVDGQQTLFVGVDTKREFTMKPWFSLREEAGVPAGERITDLALLDVPEDGLILGSGAARALDKNAGDLMDVQGRAFTVTGVLHEMGTEEDGLIYGNLAVVQGLVGRPGEFSMIEVSAYCNFCPVEEIVAQLTDVLPNGRVTALRQAALIREETIDRFSSFGFALSGVVLLVAALVVLVTMLSSVNERTREIGIFRAIGFRRLHVVEIIVLEVLIVSIIGGLAGFAVGNGLARVAGPFLAQMQVSIPWNTSLILPSVALSSILAVVASLYPALKAARLDPVEALRFI